MPSDTSRAGRRLDSLRSMEPRPAAARPPAPPEGFEGWARDGEFVLRRRQRIEGGAVVEWPPQLSRGAGERILFYDTETTGLSGGAGSVIFLFGAAWGDGDDLVVEQLFLTDFPGEPDFLLAVRDLCGAFGSFVSYNGATYDSHLLRTRFLMNRVAWEPGPQLDLLHHARRLWKTITGDCSLGTIEERVLGVRRESDIPGEEIPGVWLDFLRTGRPGLLPTVFDHNARDIASLAELYRLLGRIYRGDATGVTVDEQALGRWLMGRSPERGEGILTRAFDRGNAEAGIALGFHHKGNHEWEKAAAAWRSVLAGSRSVVAAIELAKHFEHRVRAPREALALVDRILGWNLPLDKRLRDEILHRRARLVRKIDGTERE
ncbi:MAG TPA: ribonuclease H-like domain-containing protein [Spirochaetia bacterium]